VRRGRLALAVAVLLALPAAANAAIVPGAIVDGPDANIVSFGDLDMAPDGTGALTYSKKVGGTQHTFVSLYSNGAWGAGAQVDTGVATATSFPHVAVGNGGRVLVTFTDAMNNLYGALKPNAASPFTLTSPDTTSNTIIDYAEVDMDPASGVAYTAFHTNTNHVRASMLPATGTTWSPVAASGNLDNNPGNANASGVGAMLGPRIAVDTAGNAVMAWPEGAATTDQAVYVRRITGTTPDPTVVKASVDTLSGHANANSSDMVDIDGGGSSSPWVVFRQLFAYGATNKPRDLARQLGGNTLSTAQVMDGLPLDTPDEGAEYPRIDVNTAGQGLAGMPRQLSFQTFGSTLASGTWSTGFRIDSGTPTGASFPVAALADSGSGLLAWIDTTGGAAATKVVARENVGGLGSQLTLSRDALGQIAGVGLEAASSASGNVGVGFAQGSAGATDPRAIVAAVVDLPKPSGGGGGGGGGSSDKTPPTISSLSLSHKAFRIGIQLPHISAKRKPVGTTINFKVSEASRTTFTFARVLSGRRVGKRCLPAIKRRAHRKHCTRYVAAKPSLVYTTTAGSHQLTFQGRLTSRRRLSPGKYRLSVVSTDAAGNNSKPKTVRFTLLPAH
jgi:hypothetical protein